MNFHQKLTWSQIKWSSMVSRSHQSSSSNSIMVLNGGKKTVKRKKLACLLEVEYWKRVFRGFIPSLNIVRWATFVYSWQWVLPWKNICKRIYSGWLAGWYWNWRALGRGKRVLKSWVVTEPLTKKQRKMHARGHKIRPPVLVVCDDQLKFEITTSITVRFISNNIN